MAISVKNKHEDMRTRFFRFNVNFRKLLIKTFYLWIINGN